MTDRSATDIEGSGPNGSWLIRPFGKTSIMAYIIIEGVKFPCSLTEFTDLEKIKAACERAVGNHD